MCSGKPPYSYAPQLYDKYKEALDEYINSTVYKELSSKAINAVIMLAIGFVFDDETKFVLQKVKHELLVVYTNQLLEKEHSESRALLRDDKVPRYGSYEAFTDRAWLHSVRDCLFRHLSSAPSILLGGALYFHFSMLAFIPSFQAPSKSPRLRLEVKS
ncbi:hypothetical protein H5410_029723 [Solanum commersonii]|uniref:Uncharacterized protein n=1 Tax=Solanum commersonii TaxID=4109 RepID=A0A9J5YDJ2_SOLCO|nr:hypothetical protein H5410_029723 [Solanum commersonii]